jgi:hypothetical protein
VRKTFRIKPLRTALETNPGIRVEIAVTKSLSQFVIILLITVLSVGRQTAVCGQANSRYGSKFAERFIGRCELEEFK